MRSVLVVAQMTFIEARRARVVWTILLFCAVLVATSFLFQEVTIASFDRIMRDVGLSAINIIGVLLAILLGVNVVARDLDRKTAFVVLVKPIPRWHYFVGRVLGVWFALVVSLGLMMAAFVCEMWLFGGPLRLVIFEAFGLMLVELLILTTFSVSCGALFSATVLSSLVSISVFIMGHITEELYEVSRRAHTEWVRVSVRALYYLLPNLERLNLKTQAASLVSMPLSDVGGRVLYGLLYVGALAVLGGAAFERRDLG